MPQDKFSLPYLERNYYVSAFCQVPYEPTAWVAQTVMSVLTNSSAGSTPRPLDESQIGAWDWTATMKRGHRGVLCGGEFRSTCTKGPMPRGDNYNATGPQLCSLGIDRR